MNLKIGSTRFSETKKMGGTVVSQEVSDVGCLLLYL